MQDPADRWPMRVRVALATVSGVAWASLWVLPYAAAWSPAPFRVLAVLLVAPPLAFLARMWRDWSVLVAVAVLASVVAAALWLSIYGVAPTTTASTLRVVGGSLAEWSPTWAFSALLLFLRRRSSVRLRAGAAQP